MTTDERQAKWTRRRFLAAASATAAGALLAACGGSTTPTATTAPKPQIQPPITPQASSATVAPTASAAAAAASVAAPATSAAAPVASAAPAASTGATGGQVSMYWVKPVTIHPLFSSSGVEQGVERQMFGALVRMTDKLEPIPDLAEKIDVSPDAKVYTFTLKKGLTFSDGHPLTSKDVVFTYERAVDKRSGSYWRARLLALDGAADFGDQKAPTIKGLEAPDDYTVKMTLTTPDSTWLITIGDFAGLSILPKHILESTPPDQMQKAPFSFAPTPSAGAFTFSDWKQDQYLEIKRNETYTGGPKAKLDKIFCKALTQEDVGIAQLEKGEIDLMTVSVTEADRLRKNPNLTVVSVPSPSVSFLAYNLDKPYLKDKRVRQALAYAIDREGIVKEILKGEATLVNSTIIGPDWMGIPEGLNAYKYDPNKAKQLLKEANWNGAQKLALPYVPGNKINDALIPILQQQFKDVGITLDLQSVDNSEINRRIFGIATAAQAGDFDVDLVGGGVFRTDPNVSAKYFETIAFTPAGANYGHYSNTKVDDLFKQGRATTDKAQRKKIYTDLALILNDEMPWVYLWSPNSVHVYTKRLQGFKPPSYATHQVWNAEEWSVTK
ncbi:MAG: ABC transporter substrate-binding protein [Chloroflexota bacterium]|nr:ABC transporter substrate-binding protein [Chloroflexota bacterium]